MEFRWNDWNLEHVPRHGVTPAEAETAVRAARAPFPKRIDSDKWLVWGRGTSERLVQVIYLLDASDVAYVIHARPLTEREKKRYRRRARP